MKSPFTTRLAPSPTGSLHLGNARTLAITWWWARATGSRILLRIEDLDSPRKKPDAVDELREDLAWLGLDYDHETTIQTARSGRHRAALDRLLSQNAIYACVCSRKDVEEAQSAPHETPADLGYPGTCRSLGLPIDDAVRLAGRPVALRFRVAQGPVAVDDLVLGRHGIDLSTSGGDFVVGRAASSDAILPGYQLAVVVDDHDDGVTRVIRGQDLLVSAARQILVQQALGIGAVTYGHVPLVVGPDGRRLAKRHGDTRVRSLRAAGATREGLWRWIAESIGRRFTSVADLIAGGFDPAWIPRDPVLAPGPGRSWA